MPRLVRPALVIADPEAMTSLPEHALRASSMNALAHGADSLYTPFANPVSEMTALRGAELIATSLDQARAERDRAALALGSILCGYAIDSGHVRPPPRDLPDAGADLRQPPRRDQRRDPAPRDGLPAPPARPPSSPPSPTTIGTDLEGLEPRILDLGGNPPGLAAAGADRALLDQAIEAILQRPELAFVPGPSPTEKDLAELIDQAW